jgi:hypothetical protein
VGGGPTAREQQEQALRTAIPSLRSSEVEEAAGWWEGRTAGRSMWTTRTR